MSDGIWAAASGASAQLLALDATANNLANASTLGYKGDSAVFREHLMTAVEGGRATKQMRFVAIDSFAHDLSDGPIASTGRPLDAAIEGEGFFAVRTDKGDRYTRAGSFNVSAKGQLVALGGVPVLNEAGRPITVPTGTHQVRITADGGLEVDGAVTAHLKLVKFPKQTGLEREGDVLFRATAASGPAKVSPITLKTEALEGANVSVVGGMTSIVTTTRTFDAMERVIETFRDVDRRAAMDVGKVP